MRFFSYLDKLIAENRVLKFAILAMGVTNVVLGGLYLEARGDQRVVVVPPEVRKEFWVAGSEVSRSYLEQVFYYVSFSLLNVSPETVDESLTRVYVFLTTDPSILEKIKEAFREYAEAIKRKKVYQAFYPVSFEVKGNVAVVKGIVKKVVGAGEVEEEGKVIKYTFSVRNGRLFIEGIEL